MHIERNAQISDDLRLPNTLVTLGKNWLIEVRSLMRVSKLINFLIQQAQKQDTFQHHFPNLAVIEIGKNLVVIKHRIELLLQLNFGGPYFVLIFGQLQFVQLI